MVSKCEPKFSFSRFSYLNYVKEVIECNDRTNRVITTSSNHVVVGVKDFLAALSTSSLMT